jgi:CubicO group peptidase (beta-lactamase class C family)
MDVARRGVRLELAWRSALVWLLGSLLAAAFMVRDARPSGPHGEAQKLSELRGLEAAKIVDSAAGDAGLDGLDGLDGRDGLQELDRRVARIVERDLGGAGVSLVLIDEGEIAWEAGHGLADIERGVPTTPHTRYRVGSISKSLVAAAVMRAERQGHVSLDRPVRELTPGVHDEGAFSEHPVTLAHLLEHSSGFDEMRFNEIIAQDHERAWSLERILERNPRSRRVRWRPGSRSAYSQPGYTVAAHALERATGRTFDGYLRDEVFGPLDMTGASFLESPRGSQIAVGYERSASGVTRAPEFAVFHRPAGGLIVSAHDLANFVVMLVGRGSREGSAFLSVDAVERIEEGQTLPYKGLAPSYGLGNYRSEWGGRLVSGHGGWRPGYWSMIRYDPESRRGFVLLMNLTNDGGAYHRLASLLRTYMTRGTKPIDTEPQIDAPRSQLERWEGSYRFASPSVSFSSLLGSRWEREVEVASGELRLCESGRRCQRLLPVGDGRFRRSEERGASLVFAESSEGYPVMFDGWGHDYFEAAHTPVLDGLRAAVLTLVILALAAPIVWVPLICIDGFSGLRGRWLWILPSAASGSLVGMVLLVFRVPIPDLGRVTLATLLVFLFSWFFAVCGTAGWLVAVRSLFDRTSAHVCVRVFALLASSAHLCVVVYLLVNGLLGLRTWRW